VFVVLSFIGETVRDRKTLLLLLLLLLLLATNKSNIVMNLNHSTKFTQENLSLLATQQGLGTNRT